MEELKEPSEEYKDFYLVEGEPLLEYVEKLANKYDPVTRYDVEGGYYISKSIVTFANKYFAGKIDKSFLQKYLDAQEVQDTIKAFGLDPEKFWYLLLFIQDYAYSSCTNVIRFNDSSKTQMKKLVDAIIGNFVKEGETIKVDKDISITLNIKGKRNIVIDNTDVISYIGCCLINGLENIEDGSALTKTSFNFNNRFSLSESIKIYHFTDMFRTFLKEYKGKQSGIYKTSLNKMLLISRLLYIIGWASEMYYKENLIKKDGTNKTIEPNNLLKDRIRKYEGHKLDSIGDYFNLSWLYTWSFGYTLH